MFAKGASQKNNEKIPLFIFKHEGDFLF